MSEVNYLQLITGVFVGLASGYLGAFMVLRRMALVGDALSHVALPGIALALVFNFNPFLGAFGTLFLGIVSIWLIENKTELSTEALVGLFFTFSLAVGILITPREDLLEALFGDISKISLTDTVLAVILSLAVIFVMRSIAKKFMLGTISPDLAKSAGVKVAAINFVFMFLVAGIVALGIKAVGTLLMGALVVIPAIASRNLTASLSNYTFASALIGLVSLVGGIILANTYQLPPGPIVVLASTAIFLVTLILKRD